MADLEPRFAELTLQQQAAYYYSRKRRRARIAAAAGGGAPASFEPLYTNTNGQGDRTATITITESFTWSNGSIGSNLVDGASANNATDSVVFPAMTVIGEWFKFDFATAHHISEFTWTQNNADAMGTWKMQGSNNDTDWTDLSTAEIIGGATSVVTTLDLIGASDSYRYYRMLGTAGTSNATAWMQEIEFKIDA